jgi:hypothetical protein
MTIIVLSFGGGEKQALYRLGSFAISQEIILVVKVLLA